MEGSRAYKIIIFQNLFWTASEPITEHGKHKISPVCFFTIGRGIVTYIVPINNMSITKYAN